MVEDHGQSEKTGASNEAINPKQSYWPIVLAASLTLTLIGVILMSHAIVLWVGVAFVIVSFIGWGMERH